MPSTTQHASLLDTLLMDVPRPMYAKDASGSFLTASPRAMELLGLRRVNGALVIGTTDQEKQLAHHLNEGDTEVVTSGQMSTCDIDLESDGRGRCTITRRPIVDENGSVYGVVTVIEVASDALEQSLTGETALHEFLAHLPAVAYLKDENLRYIFTNPEMDRLAEGDVTDSTGRSAQEIFSGEEGAFVEVLDREVLTANAPSIGIESFFDRRWQSVRFPLQSPFGTTWLGGISIDITSRVILEAAIEKLSTSFAHLEDNDFYQAICSHLSESLGCEYVFVGGLLPDGSFEVIGGVADGAPFDTRHSSLIGRPCREVLERHSCSHPDCLEQLFPDDPSVRQWGVTSSLGVALLDSTARTIGVLMIMGKSAIRDEALATAMLQAYSVSVAAEILRSRAHQLLQTNEAKYRSLFENMNLGYALYRIDRDDSGAPVDYSFVEVNDTFESITGLKRSMIEDRAVTEVIPGIEGSSSNWLSDYAHIADEGGSMDFETYASHSDQWYRVFAYRPLPGYFVTLFYDITDTKRSSDQVAASEDRLHTVFSACPIPMTLANAETGEYVEVNDAFLRLVGYEREDVLGRSIDELGVVADQSERRRFLAQLEKDMHVDGLKVGILNRNGDHIDIRLSARRVDIATVPHTLVLAESG